MQLGRIIMSLFYILLFLDVIIFVQPLLMLIYSNPTTPRLCFSKNSTHKCRSMIIFALVEDLFEQIFVSHGALSLWLVLLYALRSILQGFQFCPAVLRSKPNNIKFQND